MTIVAYGPEASAAASRPPLTPEELRVHAGVGGQMAGLVDRTIALADTASPAELERAGLTRYTQRTEDGGLEEGVVLQGTSIIDATAGSVFLMRTRGGQQAAPLYELRFV